MEKSELIPVGRVENIDDLAWDFGCKVGSLPSAYLGMPLGASFKSITVWDEVEETIFIQGREDDSNSKHVIEFTYLPYGTVVLTKLS